MCEMARFCLEIGRIPRGAQSLEIAFWGFILMNIDPP